MPFAVADRIPTRYEVVGSGPPLLMFSPGGFNATVEGWSNHGIYRRLRLVENLSSVYTCILFDRRESGQSGGRVERLSWTSFAAQGKGLLDHLGIERAHLLGGCVGCSAVTTFALTYPASAASMVLYSPAGGPRYRLMQHARFAQHAAFVRQEGLVEVVKLVRGGGGSFTEDPRVGPWVAVIRSDPDFAAAYAAQPADRYQVVIAAIARLLFDRDTAPGPEPEDLMGLDVPALIVPGRDTSHAESAARYLEECLPVAEYWNTPVDEQTEDTVIPRLRAFLDARPR